MGKFLSRYLDYEDKIAVVTGAASGMGKALTDELVALKAKVYAMDYAPMDNDDVTYIHVNLGDKASIDEAFAQIPDKIDFFFGCAGVSGEKHSFLDTFKINFLSNKYLLDEVLVGRFNENGAIGLISSEGAVDWEIKENIDELRDFSEAKTYEEAVAILEPIPVGKEIAPVEYYIVSKRALIYWALANVPKYWADNKVRINLICPGATNTGLVQDFADQVGGMEELEKYGGVSGRIATPLEMAMPLLFLCSPMASYVNGTWTIVDAGFHADHYVKGTGYEAGYQMLHR